MTWPISGNPAGWNRSLPIGSSVAVNTSGDSPFKTSAGVSFFASGICFFSLWAASRAKPAFEQARPIAVSNGEQQSRSEAVGVVRGEWRVERRESRARHRVATARESVRDVEAASADQRDERARSLRRSSARFLREQVVRREFSNDQRAPVDERLQETDQDQLAIDPAHVVLSWHERTNLFRNSSPVKERES